MVWQRGNVALRDHAESGEDVHLFARVEGGLRYVGQFVCAGYEERDDVPDVNGNPRLGFVFELVALDDELATPTLAPPPSDLAAPPTTRAHGRFRSTSCGRDLLPQPDSSRTRQRQSGRSTSGRAT